MGIFHGVAPILFRMSGVTVKDCDPAAFIQALAEHFKRSGKIELPEWHDLIKTATFKEMCPMDPDWYYVRAASIARKVYLRGGTGVGAFSKVYGGSMNSTVSVNSTPLPGKLLAWAATTTMTMMMMMMMMMT